MLSLKDVKDALSLSAPHMDELFKTCLGSSTADVEFDCFIEFLETGKVSFSVEASPRFSRNNAMDFNNLSKPPQGRRGMPPTPPRGGANVNYEPSVEHPDEPMDDIGMNNDIPTNMNNSIPTVMHEGVNDTLASSSSSEVQQDNSAVKTLILRTVDGGGEIRFAPGKPLWRKREVVKSERIVHYTTVDATGLLQELIESECTETEVLHMECRETGEFAHRETTKYEQQEKFNDEVVAEEKGSEEYVHLKSQNDEIEFMESNMPQRARPGQPQQPEPGTDYEVHDAAEAQPQPGLESEPGRC